MEKILISGGNGFVAKTLISYLRSINHDVWFLSRSKSDDPKSFQLDFTNASEINMVLKENSFDLIIHAAAHIPEPENKKDLKLCQSVNFNGTMNLLQFAVANGVKRFLYLSTISIFNGSKEHVIDEETTPCPVSDYSNSKLSAEYLCRYFAKTYNLKVPILRIGTVYGIGMNRERMINFFIEKCKNHDPVDVYNANTKLHTIYIKDVVRVISKIMSKDDGTYHLVEDSLTKKEVVSIIAKCSNSNSNLSFVEKPGTNEMRYAKTKLISVLDQQDRSFYSFKSGIEDYIKQKF